MTTAPPGRRSGAGPLHVTNPSHSLHAHPPRATIARMSDLTTGRGWRPTRMQKTIAVVVLLIVWTMMANSWADKGCRLGQGYAFVISHGGTPDRDQGCEDEPDGPEYTDQYYG